MDWVVGGSWAGGGWGWFAAAAQGEMLGGGERDAAGEGGAGGAGGAAADRARREYRERLDGLARAALLLPPSALLPGPREPGSYFLRKARTLGLLRLRRDEEELTVKRRRVIRRRPPAPPGGLRHPKKHPNTHINTMII